MDFRFTYGINFKVWCICGHLLVFQKTFMHITLYGSHTQSGRFVLLHHLGTISVAYMFITFFCNFIGLVTTQGKQLFQWSKLVQ